MRKRSTLLMVILISLCLSMAYAQTETGQITGTVMDQSGAAIPNVTVI